MASAYAGMLWTALSLKSQLWHFIKPCSYHHNPTLGPEEPSSDTSMYFQFKACSQEIIKSPSCEKIFLSQSQTSEKAHSSPRPLFRPESSNLLHIFGLVKLIPFKPLNPAPWGFASSSTAGLKIYYLGFLDFVGTSRWLQKRKKTRLFNPFQSTQISYAYLSTQLIMLCLDRALHSTSHQNLSPSMKH